MRREEVRGGKKELTKEGERKATTGREGGRKEDVDERKGMVKKEEMQRRER